MWKNKRTENLKYFGIVEYINFLSLFLCENLKWEEKPKL